MIEVQKNLKLLKKQTKGKIWDNCPPHCLKFLKNGLKQDNVESIYNVNLKHHPIMMGIQSGPNTMDHNIAISSNHHPELIW
jgi:hypothetical protein